VLAEVCRVVCVKTFGRRDLYGRQRTDYRQAAVFGAKRNALRHRLLIDDVPQTIRQGDRHSPPRSIVHLLQLCDEALAVSLSF